MDGRKLMRELYHNVDQKNLDYLNDAMSEDVKFQLGNNPATVGKEIVLSANRFFFESIESMRHTIDDIWQDQDDLICKGCVEYERLDGSAFSASFATFLKMSNGKIKDYLVYADVSGL